MPDGVSADKMTDFFGEVFGVVAGSFNRLSHEDDLKAGVPGCISRVLNVAQEDQVAQAVDFGVGAQNVNSFLEVPG